ncbi:MAG: hypothetical protein K6F77_09380 [Lachnospiraceae bacterium]|nr:hypothetical protein [Lachnospiraceae bacterium]
MGTNIAKVKKENKTEFIKVIYFDEEAAQDYLDIFNGGRKETVDTKTDDDLLTESGSNDGKERSTDFYYVLKVEIVSCTEPKISCNNSDLNGVNGNDTFSPHSPKVVTEKWLSGS